MSAATDAGTTIHEVAPDEFRISTFMSRAESRVNRLRRRVWVHP